MGRGGACGGGAGDGGDGMPDPSAMVKATEDMMKNMSPEMLASMAKAAGLDISDDKAKMVARFLPYMLKLLRIFTYLKKMWSAMWSARGRVIMAIIVLLAAAFQHYR